MAAKNKVEIFLTAVDTGLTTAFGRANKAIYAAEKGAKSYGTAMSALQSPVRALTGTLAQLGAAFGAVFATQKFVQVAEEYSGINARLKLVTGSSEELKQVQGDLYSLSQKTGTGYQENAATYTKLTVALKSTGASGKEILTINEAVSKSLVVAGTSAAETSSFLLQFGQAMGSGVLQGDELRAMLESNSYFAQQLAAALKTDIAGLRKMGSEGKLTTDKIREAVPKMLQQINADFEKMPLTIGRAMTMLENAFGKIVNGSNEAGGATGKIAAEIKTFVTYLETNGKQIEKFIVDLINMAAAVVKVGWEYRGMIANFALTAIAVSAVSSLTTAVKGLSAALATLPFAAASSFKLIGAAIAGYSLGTVLYKQFDFVKKFGNILAATFTWIALNVQLAWAKIFGGDVKGVQSNIDAAIRIYNEMYQEIGNGADESAKSQKADHASVAESARISAEKQRQVQESAIADMKKKYQEYAAEIKRLQKEIVSEEISLDQQLRDMARSGMSDYSAWKDKKKQAQEYEVVAKAAGEAGRLALKTGNTNEAANLFKTQADYARMAKEQYAGMATEVKEGNQTIISETESLKIRMAGAKAAGEQMIDGLKGMQEAANDAQNVFTEKSGFKDLSKGMDEAEEKWLKNWQRMRSTAIEDIVAVEERLLQIKDKEVTVWINEKVKKALGGIVGKYARGGRLPGYGGGDRISALLEAGEFIVRKEAVAKFGSGFFAALNSLQFPQSLPRFATGGPVGASAASSPAAGATYNLTVNLSGSASRADGDNVARQVMAGLAKLHRSSS